MDNIAIVGIGCLFPNAKSPSDFWKILMNGVDVTSKLTTEDLGRDPSIYYHPNLGTPDKINYTKNGYIRGFSFEPDGYQVPPEKLIPLDRIFHWSLYAAKEALKDSGYLHDREVLKKTGLILGNLSFPIEYSSKLFTSMHLKALEYFVRKLLNHQNFSFGEQTSELNISLDNAITAGLPASVVCNGLGLGGIRYTIDSACATSLYVMELASYYLNTGQADMMLAGAVCSPERLYITHGFNVLHAFPNQGESIPFDQSSEGIKTGEGAGIFVLKRLRDAEQAGDRIYAVIENIGLSNDGGGKHILSPSKKGQYLALERAYQQSEPPDYIECHATGTPLGDRAELNSLEEFFADKHKVPMLGANKAHIGHMLTASGMASMIKVIWAMREGIIPATIGIQDAIVSEHKTIGSANIIQENTPWPQTSRPKRAGVNAFGFGGTNAHLILREYIPATTKPTPLVIKPTETSPSTLAIVGMHMHIGAVVGLDAFASALYDGREVMESLPPWRWAGAEETLAQRAPKAAYLEKFDFDCAAFKFPPNEIGPLVFDHLLMMKVADIALRDAGFSRHENFNKTAVIIATEMNLMAHRTVTRLNIPGHLRESLNKFNIQLTDTQVSQLESILKDSISPGFYLEGITGGIGNLAASRISALWNFTGPAFTLSAQESSVYKAIALARFLLDFGHVDAVVVGAIDLAGNWEHVEWRKKLDKHTPGLTFGEGAGAIVLKRKQEAQKAKDRIYATIESLAIVQGNGNEVEADSLYQGATTALAEAKVKPEEVGYLELSQIGIAAQDSNEIAGLSKLYSLKQKQVGSVQSNVGNSFVLSGMASIIKTSLCLYHRFLPKLPMQQSGQSWEPSNKNCKLYAAINGMSNDYSCAHMILGEGHYRNLEQHSSLTLPNIAPTKAVVKTLFNGKPRMGDIILAEENIKQFRHTQSQIVTADRSFSENFCTKDKPTVFNQGQVMLESQTVLNAKLEQIFLQIQDAFYEKIGRSLTSDNLAKPITLPQKSVEVSQNGSEAKSSHPIKADNIVAEIASKSLVWNLEQITEMVEGKISNVLGDYYQEMDSYPIRTRTPLPPFMFVSRVTKMTAKRGQLEPCMIEWEYDIPPDTCYSAHNVVTGLIPFEGSHVMLLALAYIGCDMMFKGKLRYRAIDSQVDFLSEFPPPGATIRGEVFIQQLIKTDNNLLLQYEYNCYHKNQQILRTKANSGYFSEADLQKSKGLTKLASKVQPAVKRHFSPPLTCHKNKFSDADIEALQEGDFATCFGDAYHMRKPLPLTLGNKKIQMVNRILEVDREGGPWGLGKILGEVDIDPDHWIFNAHFKNDPVLPGTMLIEGCSQVAFFYMYYLGLHTKFENFKPTVCIGVRSKAKFRGEVKKEKNKVQFRVIVKEIDNSHEPYIITITEFIYNNQVIGICEDFALKLVALS